MESSNLLLLEIIRCFLFAALDQFSLDAGSMTTSMECFGISRKTGCWPCPSVTSETLKITGKCTTSDFVRIHTHRNALLNKERTMEWWKILKSKEHYIGKNCELLQEFMFPHHTAWLETNVVFN